MRQPNKTLALLLCVCLAVSLAPIGAGAAGAVLTVVSPETLPAVGQTFTVTVDVTGNPGVAAVQFTLGYDKSVVECLSVKIGRVLSGSLSATNPAASDGARLAAVSSDAMDGDGTLGTLVFRVLAAGDAGLTLSDVVFVGGDRKDVPYTVDKKTAPSRAADPVGGEDDGGKDPLGTGDEGEDEGEEVRPSFPDVTQSHWAFDYVNRAVEAGLFSGMPDGTFQPDAPMTRAQFVTVLWRGAGEPKAAKAAPFADVPAEGYYCEAAAWAYEKGYVDGKKTADGSAVFDPNGPLQRQQAMTILFRMNGSVSGAEVMLGSIYDGQFKDSASIARYARPAMHWGIYKSYISGVSSTMLAPEGQATRAQIAKIMLGYYEDTKV